MVQTAIGGDVEEPGDTGRWCCGDRTVTGSLLRLQTHQEVGVCFRCVKWLNMRRRSVERMTRRVPPGPWWRRLQFRAGFNRC